MLNRPRVHTNFLRRISPSLNPTHSSSHQFYSNYTPSVGSNVAAQGNEIRSKNANDNEELLTDCNPRLSKQCCASFGQIGAPFPAGDRSYEKRQIGLSFQDETEMLKSLNLRTVEDLAKEVIPKSLHHDAFSEKGNDSNTMTIPTNGLNENSAIRLIQDICQLNETEWKSYIGRGFHNTHTPSVLKLNILGNPAWYSPYTPYQPEIHQGRLKALYLFQEVIKSLTDLPFANAGLHDTASAVCEAIVVALSANRRNILPHNSLVLVDCHIDPNILSVVQSRMRHLQVSLKSVNLGRPFETWGDEALLSKAVALVVQSPDIRGRIYNVREVADRVHSVGGRIITINDPLALTLFETPGQQGVDIALGSTQRLGIPMNFGGPAAAFFAVTNDLLRFLPGQLVGKGTDAQSHTAYNLALQTREQHIRKDKATSNVCTSQSLLSCLAAMYCVYKGRDALQWDARQIFNATKDLSDFVRDTGFPVMGQKSWLKEGMHFGVVSILRRDARIIKQRMDERKINLEYDLSRNLARIAIDELIVQPENMKAVEDGFVAAAKDLKLFFLPSGNFNRNPGQKRTTPILTDQIFEKSKSDLEMMRLVHELGSRDFGLQNGMIPMGSCTMKNNPSAGVELGLNHLPMGNSHPLAPIDQNLGSFLLSSLLSSFLAEITQLPAVSLQPNSGATGELAGLIAIRNYFQSQGEAKRNICLIPQSAHGSNFAAAKAAGLTIVPIPVKDGVVTYNETKQICEMFGARIACIMLTYPSTHGIFDEDILQITECIHDCGGLVYIDGVNFNALLGLSTPFAVGGDICHLTLHKTFGTAHGGGGPGLGPLCAKRFLEPFLPTRDYMLENRQTLKQLGISVPSGKHGLSFTQGSLSPIGSSSLNISALMYILLMGKSGLKRSSQIALLNANYIRRRLIDAGLKVLHPENRFCGHGLILDLSGVLENTPFTDETFAKRLLDYGLHSPTVAWPVRNSLMIEPTESENKSQLDRLIDAIVSVAREFQDVKDNKVSSKDSPLATVPHTLEYIIESKRFDKIPNLRFG